MTTDVWLFEYTFRTRADWWLRKFPMCSPYMMIPLGVVTMGRQWWPWMTRRRRRWPNPPRLMMPILVISTSASLTPTYFSRAFTSRHQRLICLSRLFKSSTAFVGIEQWPLNMHSIGFCVPCVYFAHVVLFCGSTIPLQCYILRPRSSIVFKFFHHYQHHHPHQVITSGGNILRQRKKFQLTITLTFNVSKLLIGFIYFWKCYCSVLIRPENINTDIPSPHIPIPYHPSLLPD